MLRTLKFKVVGLACVVATTAILVLALPAYNLNVQP
jgi:hypothetical protein